jgi:biotin operon repressor
VSNAEIAKALGVSERDVEEGICELQFVEAV